MYVGAFFIAAVVDTKIIWDIATVIGPIATIPNLIALILLRKEIKQIDEGYKVVKKPEQLSCCLLYTSPSPRDRQKSRMPSSA